MAKNYEVYKCEACGSIVEVIHGGGGELVCCGEPMKLMVENTVDAAKEKHVPVIEKVDGGVKVKVGEVPHPMEEKHYIDGSISWQRAKHIDSIYVSANQPKLSSRQMRRMSLPVDIATCMDSGKHNPI